MPATLPTPTFLTGDQVPDHLRGVEILSVGMDWPASTGAATFTREHLEDIVRAANEDPHIQPPRVRLGHTSALNDGMPQFDPFAELGDAEPAFGRLVNLRLVNDGAVLVADFDEVPVWLAEAAPSMFPSRSAEVVWDVRTAGHRYSAVLTAVALLGAELPAVRDLEDLQRLAAAGPAALTQEAAAMSSRGAALSVSTDEVRTRFDFGWCLDPDSIFETDDGRTIDPTYWWCREVRLSPNEVIADDDAGHLWRVPFTVTDTDEIVFGDPQRVRAQYVAASGAPVDEQTDRIVHVEANGSARQRAVACFARRHQTVAATFTARPTKPNLAAASRRPSNQEETTTMDVDTTLLRRRLGLPDDATEEQIREALTAAPDSADSSSGPAADAEAEAGAEAPAADEVEPVPVAASIADERGVIVDRDALAQLQADAAAGREAREAQLRAEREAFLSAAVQAGKFPPSAKAAYAAQLAQGGDVERQTREFIDRLPEGVVPLEPAGSGQQPAAASGEIGDDAYRRYMKANHGIEVS